MSARDPLQYRPCVGVMLVNSAGQAFVGKRIDNKEGDWWQMPQGGVDDGEDLDEAMLRELREEIGAEAACRNRRTAARGAVLRPPARAPRQAVGREVPRPAADVVPGAVHRDRCRHRP